MWDLGLWSQFCSRSQRYCMGYELTDTTLSFSFANKVTRLLDNDFRLRSADIY